MFGKLFNLFLDVKVSPEELLDCIKRTEYTDEIQVVPDGQSEFSTLVTNYINENRETELNELILFLVACVYIFDIARDPEYRKYTGMVNNMVNDVLHNEDKQQIKNKLVETAKKNLDDEILLVICCGLIVVLNEN